MARNVFEDDNGPEEEAEIKPLRPAPRRSPLLKGGAAAPKYIQGSTQSAAERTHEDIPVNQIQDSLIEDRIDVNEGLDELVESIDKNGQQIPIIVRIVKQEKPYEIVAGRRRLAAIRKLGQPTIRGYITRMTDKEAFIAQGIENSARLETSFIERARAAAKGTQAGYTTQDVADFLNISKTLVSFMVRTYAGLGEDLVVRVGPARGIGRRKWEALLSAMELQGVSAAQAAQLVDPTIDDSCERFEALLKAVENGARVSRPNPAPQAISNTYLGGRLSTSRKPSQILVKAGRGVPPELLDTIHKKIEEAVAEFQEKEE